MKILTVEDVADQLQIKRDTVYELIKRGELPASRVGKQFRVFQADLNQYLQGNKKRKVDTVVLEEEETATKTKPAKVILCVNDRCLDYLLARITGLGGIACRSFRGSYDSLYELYHGRLTMTAIHLWDSETGGYNYPFVKWLLPGCPAGVLRLAGRMQGFYVKKGNPLGIRGWNDLARPGMRIVNRKWGSGSRVLLDQKLTMLGITPDAIRGYDREYASCMVCGSVVAKGGADLCLGCRTEAADINGVDFIPLQHEWYDLVFCLSDIQSPAINTIIAYVQSEEFTQDLLLIGDYDISQTGKFETVGK
jgi:putative molybdopterin biosynthesis protein